MDVVYQIMNQFPTAFEFSSDLLIFLSDHVYSCLFGNFLGNCEFERETELNVLEFTKSIWSYVLDNKAMYTNENYKAYGSPIWPSFAISSIVMWRRFWQRWDTSAHPNRLHVNPWHDDWGGGRETHPEYAKHHKHSPEDFSKVTSWTSVAVAAGAVGITAADAADDSSSTSASVAGMQISTDGASVLTTDVDTATATDSDATAAVVAGVGPGEIHAGRRASILMRAANAQSSRRSTADSEADANANETASSSFEEEGCV
jgi:hypothetical protein